MALEIFRKQAKINPVYKKYINTLGVQPASIKRLEDIPFLPIGFFKSHEIKSGDFQPQLIFESSGTTQQTTSRHFLKSEKLYKESFLNGFRLFYGDIKNWCILGLLPGYLERQNSSLIYMVNTLIELSGHAQSGFFLRDQSKLFDVIQENERNAQPTLLVGVTYALLDFARQFPADWIHTTVMETGGMKGTRREITRVEVQDILKKAWNLSSVHSEYGMTELLSQSYAQGTKFQSPPWMKIGIREHNDPFSISFSSKEKSQNGIINVIDLANLYSCCFIATDDVGRLYNDGSFEVLGRRDTSDVRGCSLLTI